LINYFLRQPNSLNRQRPPANKGSAAGIGTTDGEILPLLNG